MTLTIQPIDPARADFAARVTGLDIADGISAETAAGI